MPTVQSGDNLSKLAKEMGVSLGALMAANPGINPHLIHPGQHLNAPRSGSVGARENARQMSRMVGSAGFRTPDEIRSGKTLEEAFADRGFFAPSDFEGFQAGVDAGVFGGGATPTAGQEDANAQASGVTIHPAAGTGQVSTRFQDDSGAAGPQVLDDQKAFLQTLSGTPAAPSRLQQQEALGQGRTAGELPTDIVGRRPGDPGYIRTGVGSATDTGGGFNIGATFESLLAKFGVGGTNLLDFYGPSFTEKFITTPEAVGAGVAADAGGSEGTAFTSAYSAAGIEARAARMQEAHPEWTEEEVEARIIASNEGTIFNPESPDHGRRIVDAVFDPRSDTYNKSEANDWVARQRSTESAVFGTPMGIAELEILGFNVARSIVEATDAGMSIDEIRDNHMPDIASATIMAVAADRLGMSFEDYVREFRYLPINDDASMYALADPLAGLVPFQQDIRTSSFSRGGGRGGSSGGGFGSPSSLSHDWRIRITA